MAKNSQVTAGPLTGIRAELPRLSGPRPYSPPWIWTNTPVALRGERAPEVPAEEKQGEEKGEMGGRSGGRCFERAPVQRSPGSTKTRLPPLPAAIAPPPAIATPPARRGPADAPPARAGDAGTGAGRPEGRAGARGPREDAGPEAGPAPAQPEPHLPGDPQPAGRRGVLHQRAGLRGDQAAGLLRLRGRLVRPPAPARPHALCRHARGVS